MNITLKSLSRKILKKWYIIVIITLLCALCGLVYTNYYNRVEYKLSASANMYFEEKVYVDVEESTEDIKKVSIGNEGVTHLNKLIASKEFNVTLAENLKAKNVANVDYDNLPKYFKVAKAEGSEYLINFYVTHPSEDTGEVLLNEFQEVLTESINKNPLYLDRYAKIDNFSEVYNTDIINIGGDEKIIILLTFLGFSFSVILLAVYAVLSNKLNNVDSYEEDFDLELLGSINLEIKNDNENDKLFDKKGDLK